MTTRQPRPFDPSLDSDVPEYPEVWRAVAWIVGLLLLGCAAYGLWCLVAH